MLAAESIVYRLKNNNTRFGITLNPPASTTELDHLETLLNRKLPIELRDFYLLANGFETLDYMFRVLPIDEIIQYHHELPDNEIFFAEYMIYSDCWRIVFDDADTEKYSVINDDHGRGEVIVLTNSIFEFFERYLASDGALGKDGFYEWREEIMGETPMKSLSPKPIQSKIISLLKAIQGLAVIYLIFCLLFLMFILSRGHQIPAETKLTGGLNIYICLHSDNNRDNTISSKEKITLEDCLCQPIQESKIQNW